MNSNRFYNAHHSPIGAFATMTFGYKGSKGGLATELKGPADESIFVGLEESRRQGMYQCLPFFDGTEESAADDYDIEGLRDYQHRKSIFPFSDDDIERTLGASLDTWKAGDLTFTVYTPVRSIPDPETAAPADLQLALVPAIILELTVDNRKGTFARKAFLGFSGSNRKRTMRPWKIGDLTAVGQANSTAIATLDPTAYAGTAFQPEAILDPRWPENLDFTLGNTGLLVVEVPAGEIKTVQFTAAFFENDPATTGLETNYFYKSLFASMDEVLDYSLKNADDIIAPCQPLDDYLSATLGDVRSATLGHAIKSYFGSSQFLQTPEGKPLWVINEGEYRMMNTFDLTVDQIYFELALNPWTVRNVLDQFVERYSYYDDVKFPDSDQTYPGGLTFTHDMGVANHFSPPGRSCYEQAGLKGVFSYMSCEELINWILCSCLYLSHTRDVQWAKQNQSTLADALRSLVNRDHPDPQQRNGVMSLDSTRCQTGAEITTYDSLDKSLGQARNNLYLAVKTWACYALIEEHLLTLGEGVLADLARSQAKLCAQTIVDSADEQGFLPAVIGEGVDARIIPAIEGLIFPYIAGRLELVSADGPYADLRATLEKHLDLCFSTGVCRFPDGGWKLSSTSRNSWLSKIYLCQAIAEQLLKLPVDQKADNAHWNWLMDEDNSYFAWSDQMLAGKAHGSRYYPRGVTAILWLADQEAPLKSIREILLGNPSKQDALI